MSNEFTTALAREAYEWHRLGQGETSWDRHVVPEPYFYPFFGHGALVRQTPLVDDGRTETFLSELTAKLKGAFRSPSPVPRPYLEAEPEFLKPLRSGQAPDFLKDGRDELFHAAWLLPQDIDWNPKEWEPLLYSLAGADFPVCLEILAADGKTQFRWIVEEQDRGVLTDSTAAAGLGVQPQTDPLLEWIDNQAGEIFFWSQELALEKEFLFPIRSDFRSDPYEGILASLSRLSANELGVIQILFSPCARPWAESLWKSVSREDGKPFFVGGQSYLQSAKEKCSTPLFAASIRLAVFSTKEDAPPLVERLPRSFNCFAEANGFVFADPVSQSEEDKIADLLQRRFRRSGMILNAAELFALVHPPSSGVGSGSLQRMVTSTRQVPLRHIKSSGLLLGVNEHAGESLECRLTPDERSRHLHVLGASGTGKSTFLLQSILQDLEQGNGLALLDPHGDLVEAVLDRLPEHRIKDVVIFNPADTEFPVGFNILRAHTDIEKNLLASDFVAIFERLSSSWGDQMSAVLGNAALALLESDQGGTLVDLKRFLIEKTFRENFLKSVRDPEVVYFWKQEFPLLRGTTQGSLLTRLSGFLRHRLIRNMVSQRGERFDVSTMMDEGKVILAPLSQGLIGQENSWLLGSLLVSRFHQAALSRQTQEEGARRPFYLYLDEAHNFVTPSIASILSGTRKYGLSLVLAHQELDQFPSRESGILGSILTNCHSRVSFRLGDHDAARLQPGFAHFKAQDLRSLGVGEAICRIGGSDGDFNLRTPPMPPPSTGFEERRERAIANSRAAYASPRAEVEKSHGNDLGLQLPEPKPAAQKSPAVVRSAKHDAPATIAEDLIPVLQKEPATAAMETPPLAEAALPSAEKTRTPGRGGSGHKTLQKKIKMLGNGLGFRVSIEAELPDRAGSIDVLLENDRGQIAFEVAYRSPIHQEVKNIRKCVECGIPEIYVVSENAEHLSDIKAAAESEIGAELLSGTAFVAASQIGELFNRIGARLGNSETTVRKYKVKRSFKPVEDDVAQARAREIHRAVSANRSSPKSGADGFA